MPRVPEPLAGALLWTAHQRKFSVHRHPGCRCLQVRRSANKVSRAKVPQCRGCMEASTKNAWHASAYAAVKELACQLAPNLEVVAEMPLLKLVKREVQCVKQQHTDMVLVKWGGTRVLSVELDGRVHLHARGWGRETKEVADKRDALKDKTLGELKFLHMRLSHVQWQKDVGFMDAKWVAEFKALIEQL